MATKFNDYHATTAVKVLTEDRGKLPPGIIMRVSGRSQASDVVNENNRRYPRSLWERKLHEKSIVEKIKNRQMVGHFGHPKDGQEDDPNRITHIVTDAVLEDDGTVNCTYEIFDVPAGHVVATMYRAGVKMGSSSRGEGSVIRASDGVDEVDEETYELDTWDFVLNPSTPDAYPTVMNEGVEKRNNNIEDATIGLIKSTSDVSVLSECSRVASSLNSIKLHEAVSSRLSEIKENDGTEKLISQITKLTEAMNSMQSDMQMIMGDSNGGGNLGKFYCDSCEEEFEKDTMLPEGDVPDCPKCGNQSKPAKKKETNDGGVSNDDDRPVFKRMRAAESLLAESLKHIQRLKVYERFARSYEEVTSNLVEQIATSNVRPLAKRALRFVVPGQRKIAENLFSKCESRGDVRKTFRLLFESGAIDTNTNPMNETMDEDVWSLYERIVAVLGHETLCEELLRAMSTVEAMENLEFIAQMHDITDEPEGRSERTPDGGKMTFEEQGDDNPPTNPEPQVYARPGSVSSGTMRTDDLIPAFLDTVGSLDPDVENRIKAEFAIGDVDDYRTWVEEHPTDAQEMLEELFDILGEYAPTGYYFGSHPGDGADYGYWQDEGVDMPEQKGGFRKSVQESIKTITGATRRTQQKTRRNESRRSPDFDQDDDTRFIDRMNQTVRKVTHARRKK
jgi:hypothetical protein